MAKKQTRKQEDAIVAKLMKPAIASNDIQDRFVHVKSKLRAVFTLLGDVKDTEDERDLDAAWMLAVELCDDVKALESKVLALICRPVVQAP